MSITVKDLQDKFRIGYDAHYTSIKEAMEIIDMYHNRQYTTDQLNTLSNRGQPPETFNVIKMFARMLLGYYSTVVNQVKTEPVNEDDIVTAGILQDLADYVFRTNNFTSEGDKIKLDGLLVGLMCSYTDVVETGEVDEFGRPKYNIEINHVPALEIILDPMSRLDDYSDARWIHRYKWIAEETFIRLYGKDKIKEVESYRNHLDIENGEYEDTYNTRAHGKYKYYDNYQVVHTIIEDEGGKVWSIHWCGEAILSKEEVTYKDVKNPYRVQKLHTSNRTEFYGIFREIKATQQAINQALIKIQLMVNTQKAMIEDGAVEDLEEFEDQFYRVNSIIPVKDLAGIKIENLTREVLDQYTVIDKALDRIQRILSINDSFLGMAYASDSGSKVRLQQNASTVAQRYITAKIEQFYRLLGWDVINLIKQYFTAHDVVRIADNYIGERWVEVNRPAMVPSGINPDGSPAMRMVFEEVTNPASGEPLTDSDGNLIMAPIPTADTEIAFTKADITVSSVSYNDEDEKNQQILEQFVNGPMGNILSQVNPVGYFKAGSLAIRNTKTKYSLELSNILDETSQMMGGSPQEAAMQQGMLPGQGSQAEAINNLSGRS